MGETERDCTADWERGGFCDAALAPALRAGPTGAQGQISLGGS